MKEYVWGVISGSKSLDDWDAYVQQIESLGVQDIIDELTTIHGAQMKEYEEYMKKAQ